MINARFNLLPEIIDPRQMIYRLPGTTHSIDGVFDRAVALTATRDYPDRLSLQSTEIAAGCFATCRAEGLVRLASPPAGRVTIDAAGTGLGPSHTALADDVAAGASPTRIHLLINLGLLADLDLSRRAG